jgi:HAD superfamily hydrolase (TIGR01509 family)
VFFDMDGLLVDSEPLWYEVESAVMARLGGRWRPADQHALIGGTLEQTVGYLLDRAAGAAASGGAELGGARPLPGRAEVGRWLIDGMTGLLAERDLPLLPGAGELHDELAAAGIPTALVSSSQPQIVAAVLASVGQRFDAVVTGADVRHGKPHPEPYARAAALLGADPRWCVALEDSVTGAAAAAAAGCSVVVVPTFDAAAVGRHGLVVPSLKSVDLALLRSLVPALVAD